jgi:hypothetical protein
MTTIIGGEAMDITATAMGIVMTAMMIGGIAAAMTTTTIGGGLAGSAATLITTMINGSGKAAEENFGAAQDHGSRP